MKTLLEGIKLTLTTSKKCRIVFPVLTIFFSFLFFFTPIFSSNIPVKNQLEYLGLKGVLLILIFSTLSALSFTMFLYSSFFMKKPALKEAGGAGLGILSGFLSALLTTASCSYCLIAFFGFLGSNGIFFIFENKNKITLFSIALLTITLYFLSKRIVESCPKCKIEL